MDSTKRRREKRKETKMQRPRHVQMLYTDDLIHVSWQPYKLNSRSRNIILFFVIFTTVILPTTKLKLPSQVAVLTSSKAQAPCNRTAWHWCLNSPSPHTVLTPCARGFYCTLMLPPPYLRVCSWWERPVCPGHAFLFCALENTPQLSRVTHMDCELWG